MKFPFVPVLVTLAIVAGLLLLGSGGSGPSTPTLTEAPQRGLGYSAVDADLIQTGPDGRPLYRLEAATIRQYPGADRVELEHLQLGFRDSGGNDWTARALRGSLGPGQGVRPGTQTDPGNGVVKLEGDVHVSGVLSGVQQAAEIATERLSIDTRTQVVTTHDPVTLTWSGRQLQAAGLMASLRERRVRLEAAVHGTFIP